MRQDRQVFSSRICCLFSLFTLLACSAPAVFAQKTVVQDIGGGRKMEMDYDAAGKVTETRTVDADGKLMEKIDYEYLPGYFGAQQTNTSYWPGGKTVRSVTRVTYDPSSNFTSEFIQVYNESGKQVAGHKLTHDPMTGVYQCANWDPAAQDYKAIKCPAGEEGGEGPEKVKKFTYEEVIQHLEAARRAAREEQKIGRMHPMTPVQPPITTLNKEIGVVLPAEAQPGERISGIVVEDPKKYEAMAEVKVFRITIPFESAGEAAHLHGWNLEAPGERAQPADGPISFIVPRSGSGFNITFRQGGNPDRSVSQPVDFSGGPRNAKAKAIHSYKAPALCLEGQLCTVSGPFSGDSRKTFAAFDERPAIIVAETPEAAYLETPDGMEPGGRPLFIAEGSKLVALPTTVANFFIKNNGRKLEAGQTLIVFPTLDGPGKIPDPLWKPGNFPAGNLELARKLIPGFQMLCTNREAAGKRETIKNQEAKKGGDAKEKKDAGEAEILLILQNPMPEQISLRGSKDQTIVFHLNDQSLTRGEFKYDLVVEVLKPGAIDVKGYVIPFLAPVAGQEFVIKTEESAKQPQPIR